MEATTVYLVGGITTALSVVAPSLFEPGQTAAQYTALPTDSVQFFVRRDNGRPNTVINVFSGDGRHMYYLERHSRFSTIWGLHQKDSLRRIANINAGLVNKSVDFLNKPGLQHRKITGGSWLGVDASTKFYLQDGASYQWSRDTQFLERIINPGGGHEEVHERLARVKLSRRFKFDWEVLVSRSFDPEIAIATALIPMLSQWSVFFLGTAPGSRTATSSPATGANVPTMPGAAPGEPAGPEHLSAGFAGSAGSAGLAAAASNSREPVQTTRPRAAAPLSGPTIGPADGERVGDIPPELLAYGEPKEVREFFNPPGFLQK